MRCAGTVITALLALPAPVFCVAAFAATGAAAQECRVDFDVAPADAGLAAVTLDAPCAAGQDVILFHDALTFSAPLDDKGHLAIKLPALAPQVLVMASLADGTSAAAVTQVTVGTAGVVFMADTLTTDMVRRDRATTLGGHALYWADGTDLPITVKVEDCEQTLAATIIKIDAALHAEVLPLSVAMPSCDAPAGLVITVPLGG